MVEGIRGLGLGTVQPLLDYPNKPNLAMKFTETLIFGTADREIDKLLFPIVQKYIANTKRFL